MPEIVALATVVAAVISAVGAIVSGIYGATSRQRSREMDRLDRKISEVESDIWAAFRGLPEAHPTRREWQMLTRQFDDLRGEIRGLREKVAQDTERILNAIQQGQ